MLHVSQYVSTSMSRWEAHFGMADVLSDDACAAGEAAPLLLALLILALLILALLLALLLLMLLLLLIVALLPL